MAQCKTAESPLLTHWRYCSLALTHWGWVTHLCVSKLTSIASDNGLSPGRRHAIIWTNAGILLIRLLGTNFNEMLIEILKFSFMKMHLKVSSAKWRPFCLGLNELSHWYGLLCCCPIILLKYLGMTPGGNCEDYNPGTLSTLWSHCKFVWRLCTCEWNLCVFNL